MRVSEADAVASYVLEHKFKRLHERTARRIAEKGPVLVPPKSSLGRDDARTHPYQLSHAVVGALVMADDHLQALDALLWPKNGELGALHMYAPCTLLRAALEGAATAYWLIEPQSHQERVKRRLQLEATNITDGDSFVRRAGLAPNGRSPQERRNELCELATVNGVPATQALARVRMASIVEYASGVGTHRLDARACWEALSGFAHGRTWASLGFLDREIIDTSEDGGVVTLKLTNRLGIVAWAASVVDDVIGATEKRWTSRSRTH